MGALDLWNSLSFRGCIPGLERISRLLELCENPQKKLKFIHIAGTNGKGSVARMIAAIFSQAGYNTGLFTSPHLVRVNESIIVNGQEIPDIEMSNISDTLLPLVNSMDDKPTTFELTTCIAIKYFLDKNCDIVVMEVGLGGLLDSTNVIDKPELAVLCNIGVDHTGMLGNTIEEITLNKCGILKEGCEAVSYSQSPPAMDVIRQVAISRKIPLTVVDESALTYLGHDDSFQYFDYKDMKNIRLSLLGKYQIHNAALVLEVIWRLISKGWKISGQNILDALSVVSWPGRFEILRKDPLCIADGSHNPQGFMALKENLEEYLKGKKIIAVTGVMADKDYTSMYEMICPYIDEFICVTPENPRALDGNSLAELLNGMGSRARAQKSIPKALSCAFDIAGDDKVILIFGSLYMLGEVREYIQAGL